MKGVFKKTERRGLPGGPNEMFTYVTGVFSTQGYKSNSPDVDNPFNIIPSGNITMKGVDFPVHGVDNLGNSQIMYPGNDYKFPGSSVFETPLRDLEEYQTGGPTEQQIATDPELRDWHKYNTPLTEEEQKAFKEWKVKANIGEWDRGAYDIQGYWKEQVMSPEGDIVDAEGHRPDTYKKPNHPTFSTESKYANEATPGYWDGPKYYAPATHKELYGDDYYAWMRERNIEDGRPEHLAGYMLPEVVITPEYQTGQRLDTPIKPSLNVRHTKTFQEGGPLDSLPYSIKDMSLGSDLEYERQYVKDNYGNPNKEVADRVFAYMKLIEEADAQQQTLDAQREEEAYLEKFVPASDNTRVETRAINPLTPEEKTIAKEYAEARKKEQEDFEKRQWKKYDDASTFDAALDRAQAFAVDPIGMTARFITGDQAYFPGMGRGLLNSDSPEYENYLRAVGYTPGEIEASDIQNMINPMYWGASIGNNINKGNYGTAALEAGLTALPLLPKGTGRALASNVRQGSKRLVNKAFNTPNWWKGYKPIETPSVVNAAEAVGPKAWQLQEMPGLHLKSTMENGAISKIVEPKTGLVNVEQALGIIGKESGGADKVKLIKEALGDNVPLKMDYNQFRKTVQDQLIPLEKNIYNHSSSYGLERIGYKENLYTPIENKTLILSNKNKFGRGSSAHSNPDETLGHIHFLRDAETPDVLTVTQIQSDAFQGTHRIMPKTFNKEQQLKSLAGMEDIAKRQKDIAQNAKQLNANTWELPNGTKVDKSVIESMKKGQDEINLMKKAEIENFTQKQLLDKTHQERYIQELVDYAAKRGDTNKLRLPTSETAAKIQGYTKRVTGASEDWGGPMSNKGKIFEDYSPEHKTILKKYSEQPKTIKKLFGVEPKIVTDSKGNTWYEFDIPENFKTGKGEIKAFAIGGEYDEYQSGGEFRGKLIEQPKPAVRNPISIEPRSAELFENKETPLKEIPVRYTSTQFPGVRVAHYPDGTKAYVNEEGQMSEYTYGQMPRFDESFQYQTGREVKVDDGTGNITTINTSSQEYKNLYPNLAYRDDDGNPVFYMPEIEIAYDKNTGDELPYYSYLSPSQKQWLETHQGADDPITRSIRSQAREGYGIGDNPTWMESAGDAARSFAFSGPITALNMLSVPQSLMVEGVEQLRGNPYDYSRAFDISPLTNTRDQGMFYTDQRFPSQTLLDEDAHWGLKLGLDVLADPANLIPAKALGTAAKATSAAAKYKQLLKAKKLGEDIPEATLKFAERQAIKEYQSSVSPFAKSASQIEREADRWVPGQKWHDAINPFAGKKYDNMKQELVLEQGKLRKNIREGNVKLGDLNNEQSRMSSWQQGKRFEFADDFRDISNRNQVTDYLERKMSQYPDPFEIGESRNAQKKITRELEGRDIRLDPEGGILKLEEPAGSQLIYEAADAVRLTPNPNKPIIDFTTGQTYTPKNLTPTAGSKKYTLVDGKVESELVSAGNKRIGFDEGLSNVYSKNENFIKEQMPGFHPMGSSQYHKFGVSHVTNDFDGIIKAEDWDKVKGNFQNATSKAKYGPTISLRNPDLPGNPVVGEVDVNIIYTNSKTGKAEGGLATELYRQFYPDEFYKASEEAIKKGPGTPITINKTADEILEVYDPEIKSILDTFEAGASGADTKLKHINKIDYIIEAGDPEKVLKAQELFAKSIMGKNADLGRQFSPQAFSDYENNLKILDAIKNAPNSRTLKASYVPEEIAKDPAKMQIALNDFYLNSSIYTRRINSRHDRINSYEDVLDAYKTWISDGGEAMGAGLNTVKLGEPGLGYGNVVGNRQFKLYDSGVSETPLEYIESVTNKVSGSRTITKADKETIIKLAKKNNINLPENTRIETFGDLLDIRAHAIGIKSPGQNVDEIGGFLKDVGEEFGMKAISRDNFGNSEYATVLGNIDDALDNFALSFSEHTPSLKSAKQRAENLRNVERKANMKVSRVDIDTFAKYKAIEGYLDGGLEVALKREKELQQATRKAMNKQAEIYKELESLYVDKKLKQFNEKDGQLAKLTEDRKQADKILDDLYREKNKNTLALEDLRRRQARLKSMKANVVGFGLAGVTVAGGIGFVTTMTAKEDERKARRQYVKTLNDEKIKELEKLYPDETYNQLSNRSRGLLYKEFETLSEEEKQKLLDSFYEDRAARLNKKQTGGEMVRDNTYVDIKAPQFYEAPVDNTRVEKKIVPEPMTLAQNIDFEGLKKGIAQAESLGGTLMINPESTATGLYGQRFSEIEDSYKGTREDFAKDTAYQEELFKKRFYEGLEDTETTALQKDAMDLYDEYNMQFEDFPYSYEDIAALSNFLGRQGTREYFGYVLRDGKPLEEVFPTKYGPKAKQANKTPEEYLKITRPYYTKSDGGEILKVYADYINGVLDNTPMYKKGGRIYDKLNRIYYKDAKAVGMSSPNYIMTYLVN